MAGYKYMRYTAEELDAAIEQEREHCANEDSHTCTEEKARWDGAVQQVAQLKSVIADDPSTVGVPGKNLLRNNALYETVNGVTFRVNADKSVTCNGTATENAFFVLGGTFHVEGSAIVSGAPEGGGAKIWSIQIYQLDNGEEVIRTNDYGEGNTRTYTAGEYIGKIVIRAGQTVENLTFYPMLRYTGTDATYEPYKPTLQEQLDTLLAEVTALKAAQ